MEKETDERLTAIEMKLAYMEDFVNQIQGVAVEQAKTIDKLQKEIKLMSEKIREMSNAVEGDIPNRKPPHYQIIGVFYFTQGIKLLLSDKPFILLGNIIVGNKALNCHVQVVFFTEFCDGFHHWCGVV